ncbi:putative DNA-binding protein [Leyella stercorea DSM 18206]|uniref:Putative DNA-binding protein n=1 Tax=Leyella stercorea DSM 18206 TaxID=1002367 RepID=G6B1Q5_9BACT|nr:HU family DNA-binding protein [Leyella stercorea]EHJ36160.1 putative DNA-binding protein [Leyella stercorea DSM 18206]
MSIKYEIHGIKNAKGEGKEQKYVHLFAHEPQSDHALEDDIQASCSLTKADVRAAFSALRDHMARALASGSRFHIPGVGYFSLSVGLDAPDDLPDDLPDDKMRADYIRLRNIRFRPERSLLSEVGSGVSFERAAFSSRSRQYTEEQLLSLLRHYFTTHTCLTRRILQRVAGLRESAAKKWLQHLTATGVLQKDGASNAPVYLWRG